ncbi:MAG: sulfite exporter TauE/SafE family protein, partial [Deltaproteobacteria bacterium]|nr:sulfite exporter TauE/SafE family protein [Deltaproteobacteria bacterium]MBW2536125.1 sulfite exporter TauE/SafE family protein [Deltaproteobacteria bacterium]
MTAIILLVLIVFLAFLVEATLGFGATVVTVVLGVFLFPLDLLLPAFVPLNLVLSLYLVGRYVKDVAWRLLLLRIVPLMGVGMPVGMFLFHSAGHQWLNVAFGTFVVLLSAVELWRLRSAAGQTQPLRMPARVALLVSGGMIHGAFATGGPMAVYVAGREIEGKSQFRSTLSALWFVLNAVLVIGYAIGGELGQESLTLTAYLVLPLVFGLVAGEWLHARVRVSLFRILVFALLLV